MRLLLRVILKVTLFPVMAALAVIQWTGAFVLSIGTVIMNFIAGLFFMTAVACLLFQLNTVSELKMLWIGWIFFLILPHIGMGILKQVVHLRAILMSL